jgi:hypothetical protein
MTEDVPPATLPRSTAPSAKLPYDAAHSPLTLPSNGRYGAIPRHIFAPAADIKAAPCARSGASSRNAYCWGQCCYVCDLTDRKAWSVAYQPLCRAAEEASQKEYQDLTLNPGDLDLFIRVGDDVGPRSWR